MVRWIKNYVRDKWIQISIKFKQGENANIANFVYYEKTRESFRWREHDFTFSTFHYQILLLLHSFLSYIWYFRVFWCLILGDGNVLLLF